MSIGDELFLLTVCMIVITTVACVASSRLYRLLNNSRLIQERLTEIAARQAQANQQRSEIARAMQWVVDEMSANKDSVKPQ